MIKNLLARKIMLANIGLVLLLVVGAGYLLVAIMRINPLERFNTVSVDLNRSGGLQPGNDVTYRGLRVGQVKDHKITPTGVQAEVEINKDYKIPADVDVSVQALSAAGEQYIDFKPKTDSGPYLTDGAHIAYGTNVKTPQPLSSVLDNLTNLVSQIPPERFDTIVSELDKAFKDGSAPLHTVVSGTSVALAGFDGLLPQTKGLIDNLKVIMGTTSLAQPDLGTLAANSQTIFDNLTKANAELRQFLDDSPGNVQSLGDTVNTIADPATEFTHIFSNIMNKATVRAPAFRALFPAMAFAGQRLQIPWHQTIAGPPGRFDFHVMGDIWIRPNCEYYVQPRDPKIPQDPRVPLYNYCLEPNMPATQVRGAANAPRPPGPDNTSGPPPGITPNGYEHGTTGWEDPKKLTQYDPNWKLTPLTSVSWHPNVPKDLPPFDHYGLPPNGAVENPEAFLAPIPLIEPDKHTGAYPPK
ncbi:MAG: MCE family protein [Nocardiaceae bacterium]|nr:MCE family protein [Nocardiaceae bacterium]